MKCPECGEEMIGQELYYLGYDQRAIDYECPYNCELLKWIEKSSKEE